MEATQGINFIQGFSVVVGLTVSLIGGLYLSRHYLLNRLISIYVKLNTKPVRVKFLFDEYILLILSDDSVVILKYNEDLIYEEKKVMIDDRVYSLFPGFDCSDLVARDERIKYKN